MTLQAKLEDGWLVVPCKEQHPSGVFIGVGQTEPDNWYPAFLDVPKGQAKIRPPTQGPVRVWLRVVYETREAGTIKL